MAPRGPTPSPLPTGEEKTARVRAMFDTIAPRYDLMNRLMTFGLDQSWRKGTVAALGLPVGARVLDLACGTGDLTRLALRRAIDVVGADLSAGMLAANGTPGPVVEADGSRLPFGDGAFDGVVCGYALRNFTDLGATLGECARVLRAGGRLAVLEVDTPTSPASGAPATTCGSPRPCRSSAALSPTRRPTTISRARSSTFPPPRRSAPCCARQGLLRGRHPALGGRAQPAHRGHPRRSAGDRDDRGPPRTLRAARVRARRAAVRRQPDRALRPAGADPGRLGHGAAGRGERRLRRRWRPSRARTRWAASARASSPLGALPFTGAMSGLLVIPRFTMGIARDADGVTRRWATAVGPSDTAAADHRRALRRRDLAVRDHPRPAWPTSLTRTPPSPV